MAFVDNTDHDLVLVSDESVALQEEIVRFSESLNHKRFRYKQEIDFWKHVYYKVHRKYLKTYSSPSTLNDVLVTGNYDCLSGTALYAMIFQALGADYQIIETNYHILPDTKC